MTNLLQFSVGFNRSYLEGLPAFMQYTESLGCKTTLEDLIVCLSSLRAVSGRCMPTVYVLLISLASLKVLAHLAIVLMALSVLSPPVKVLDLSLPYSTFNALKTSFHSVKLAVSRDLHFKF